MISKIIDYCRNYILIYLSSTKKLLNSWLNSIYNLLYWPISLLYSNNNYSNHKKLKLSNERWKSKYNELLDQYNELKLDYNHEKQSRVVLDSIIIKAKISTESQRKKMESDYSKFLLCKQDLIHYIKDLKEWNELNNDHDNNFLEGLLSKCETMDECNQDSDDDSDLDSLEDSESDEDFLDENKLTPHEYLSLACDTFSQLVISNVSLGSINNVLDEFIDSSGKNGLELTTCCTLCYIQTQQIEDPTALLFKLRGLFYRFIEPDNLFGSELIILNSLEEYCLPYSDTLNFQQNIIEILQKLGILHCNSIKAYKSLTIENPHYTPTFDSDSSSNSLWTFTNNDCNSFDHGRILCDSACDFHSNHSTKSCDVSSIDSRSTGDRNNEQDCKKSADILKEIPLEEYNFRFSDVSKIREYYIPTDDDVETRTILYDYDGITKGTTFDDSEMEISFEDD